MADLPDPRLFHPPTTQELLDNLEAAVISEGGRAMAAPCTPTPVFYQRPPLMPETMKFRAQPPQETCGCRNETRLAVTADPAAPLDTPAVSACAVCDAMLYWPRFMS